MSPRLGTQDCRLLPVTCGVSRTFSFLPVSTSRRTRSCLGWEAIALCPGPRLEVPSRDAELQPGDMERVFQQMHGRKEPRCPGSHPLLCLQQEDMLGAARLEGWISRGI